MPSVPLPTPDAVRDLLQNLLNTSVATRHIPAHVGPPMPRAVAAFYQRRGGAVAAAWMSELTFAAYASAAMTRFPLAHAESAIAKGVLDGSMLENFTELMNVGSALFNSLLPRYVKIGGVHQAASGPMVHGSTQLLGGPHWRLDLVVTIPGYGEGSTSLVMGGRREDDSLDMKALLSNL